ncbi:MAG: metallophosphoesterase family protein [Bryobacteraceae bacterium]|nr:metallophosphoesterase family protein [Bryobacteraceae bacterium]
MRSLILSDIHGNMPALEAVATDAAGAYDDVICLGDIVGYGADPNEVTHWVRDHATHVIRGNHDRACTGDAAIDDFSDLAYHAALWTRRRLDAASCEYLKNLPQGPCAVNGFHFAHGSPRDEDEYIFSRQDAANQYGAMPGEVCFIGHTHVQGGFSLRKGRVWIIERPAENETETVLEIEPDTWYLLNPGSVGQPRDGDPRAAYAIHDSERRTVRFRRVPYDTEAAQGRILAAGLPPFLAARLAAGR